jgi:hypothetical protein
VHVGEATGTRAGGLTTRKEADMASDKGTSELFGEGLPGTGGDFVDPNDVEGHVRHPEPDGAKNAPGPTVSTPDDSDTEGHVRLTESGGPEEGHGWGEGSPGRSSVRFIVEDDVEGHLYRSGPTTQGGEFARRGPSDNPHGDR